jgi:hypothetical protein
LKTELRITLRPAPGAELGSFRMFPGGIGEWLMRAMNALGKKRPVPVQKSGLSPNTVHLSS